LVVHVSFYWQNQVSGSSQIESFIGVPGYALSIRAVVRKLL
jgi:hypothetical protein